MTKVEEVARAIQPVLEADGEIYWASERGHSISDASLQAIARVAIAAMREMTPEMIDVFRATSVGTSWLITRYEAMIDAALQEEE